MVAHGFELGDGPLFCSLGVEPIEVVGAGIVVEPVSVTGWIAVAPGFAEAARRYIEQVTVSLRH